MSGVLIYDGLRCIGCVIERDANRCEAYDASGHALGVFVGRTKATSAVCEAARKQRVAA